MATLYWHPTGALIEWSPPSEVDRTSGMLAISDLNPETKIAWTMSRGEMVVLGWRCLVAGLMGWRARKNLTPVGGPEKKV